MDFGALHGLRVLDISRLLPGPYCSMILADHGAEVIAIEDRRFQGDDLFFSEIYRNKRHMTLNLKSEEGREIFYTLARQADVILEGFRPGVVDRLGVGYQQIAEINPEVIYCSITGYGQSGPHSAEPGHDVNYLSRSGVLDFIGEADRPPSIPGVQIADIAGGSMQAVTGILLALYSREKTGKGQYIDISMTDGLLGLLTLPKHFKDKGGLPVDRSEALLSHRYACYNTYRTSDDGCIAVGAVENRFWEKLCRYFHKMEYVDLQYDEERRQELINWLREEIAAQTTDHWQRELEELGACITRVNSLDDILESNTFRERGMIAYDGDTGSTSLGIPVRLSRTPGRIVTQPAEFGGHTREILAELGYSESDLAEFDARGVI